MRPVPWPLSNSTVRSFAPAPSAAFYEAWRRGWSVFGRGLQPVLCGPPIPFFRTVRFIGALASEMVGRGSAAQVSLPALWAWGTGVWRGSGLEAGESVLPREAHFPLIAKAKRAGAHCSLLLGFCVLSSRVASVLNLNACICACNSRTPFFSYHLLEV
jgi:hypothetical protein